MANAHVWVHGFGVCVIWFQWFVWLGSLVLGFWVQGFRTLGVVGVQVTPDATLPCASYRIQVLVNFSQYSHNVPYPTFTFYI